LQLRDWFWNGCAFTVHYQPRLGDSMNLTGRVI